VNRRVIPFVILLMLLFQAAAFAEAEPAINVNPKEEVIYAALDAAGAVQAVYAVNVLHAQPGTAVTDYGAYTQVQNLTDDTPLQWDGTSVTVTLPDSAFYYEGTLAEAPLPWDISLQYTLDGAPIAPADLGGRSGAFRLTLTTTPNPAADPGYFENYALQVSLALDARVFRDIAAPGGTLANAGSAKQVTYTLLPGTPSTLTLDASVVNFALEPISIAAVPLTMKLDDMDFSSFTEQLAPLMEGVSALKNGMNQLLLGMRATTATNDVFNNGAARVASALTTLQEDASALAAQAAASTDAALSEAAAALAAKVDALAETYTPVREGVNSLSEGLHTMRDGIAQAYEGISSLNDGVQTIPAQLSEGIQSMMARFDKSAFVPPSFTSPQNGPVRAVQFVMRTEGIAQPKDAAEELATQYPTEKTFWDKLMDLFQ
jgi:hypothetical protein